MSKAEMYSIVNLRHFFWVGSDNSCGWLTALCFLFSPFEMRIFILVILLLWYHLNWMYWRQITCLQVYRSLQHEKTHLDMRERTTHYLKILDFNMNAVNIWYFKIVFLGGGALFYMQNRGVHGYLGGQSCWKVKIKRAIFFSLDFFHRFIFHFLSAYVYWAKRKINIEN